MQIGPHTLETPLIVAPMAGVTDRPFRELCLRLGAGMAVSEMLLANPDIEQACVVGMAIPQPIALVVLSAAGKAKSKEEKCK